MKQLVRYFKKDTRASTAMTFSLSLIPLIAVTGTALDYGRAWNMTTQLQNATDAAALAAASITAYQKEQGVTSEALSKKTFAANFSDVPVAINYSERGGIHRVSVTASIPTVVMAVVGVETMGLVTKAAAVADTSLKPACFMAMHPTRKHTLELKGTVSVYAPDCHIYGNSNDVDDVVDPHTAQNFLTGKSVQAVGYGHHFIQNVTPPLEYAPRKLDDPLAALTIPSNSTCTVSKKKVSGGTATLDPGVYCGGLTFEKGANVTLNPGTYFIDGGAFTLNVATVTGSGVTIVLNDKDAVLNWQSATIRLAAPKIGSLAGIVLTGVRFPTSHQMQDSTIDLHGTVYLPQGVFDWVNSGTPTITSKWTAWIIDGVTWDGGGVVKINFDPASSDIPLPGALSAVIPRPVGTHNPRLTQY